MGMQHIMCYSGLVYCNSLVLVFHFNSCCLTTPANTYNENELLALIALGDEIAFRRVYDHYRKRIYSYAFNLTESEDRAGDLVQEIFLKVWVNREKLPGLDNFSAWLHAIARNYFFDTVKKMATETKVYKNLRIVTDEGTDETNHFILNRENEAILLQLLEKLPAQQRLVLQLKSQGYKLDEIAGEMDISKNTVKVHLKRALATLREYLKNRPDTTLVILVMLLSRSGF